MINVVFRLSFFLFFVLNILMPHVNCLVKKVTVSGGHGAPLMPSVDKAINKYSEPGKIMLNIGGLGFI